MRSKSAINAEIEQLLDELKGDITVSKRNIIVVKIRELRRQA